MQIIATTFQLRSLFMSIHTTKQQLDTNLIGEWLAKGNKITKVQEGYSKYTCNEMRKLVRGEGK